MAKTLNLVVFAALATVALLQSSVAATTYFVGDSTNWVIPPSPNTYSNWAANKTFVVGDILVFNFLQGQHDVAQVTKASYDSCNGTGAISTQQNSPANITLQTAGEHYYICTFGSHCNNGQKLAINVTGASSPAPQPATPSPASAPVPAPALATEPTASSPSPVSSPDSSPAPTPSRAPVTHTVGGTLGWSVFSNAAATYQDWAANQTFVVGDILVFNFQTGAHDVAQLTKANYNSCTTTSPVSLLKTPPVRITLNNSGEHFFVCTISGHCNLGQKLAINVTGDSTGATPPSSAATPTPSTSVPSSPSPTSTTASPPDSSAATSVGVAGLSATFLSIALALWF